ncbi:TonB-dependent receptor [Asticcacaulis endophyticus]|uniref:TonB-dependent receptor n=1 Tax=Asticcacaulis endophyticus TaxID=1395890 RepID=A0A918Q709_9CAUL|nr:TonB-dependent receptor [Asticcacaulis endophyticus]GGZ36009.1 TonB-dependent receptor [Asticcacaulis endophyticus]
MKSLPKMSRTRRRLLAGSVLASAAVLAFAGPVLAQEAAADTDTTEVVVVGARKNLQSAQQIKRNADTVVDSITSEDIGSFPDKSVAEALQRVAGITVTRFAGTDDTSHFSAEPSGVIVRGLPQVRSEFNGRDTFSANSSRGLSWGDISPELMGRIDVYKNQTAELIEGGIAGSIDLRTRLPFDSKGQSMGLTVDFSYGDRAEKWAPSVSGIWSDRWETELGEFGLMGNLAYSKVITASEGVQYDRMAIFDVDAFGPGLSYVPSGIYMRENIYDRRRKGISLAGQWRSNDRTMVATAQFNRSTYDNSWKERSIYSSAFSIYGAATDSIVTDPALLGALSGTDPLVFNDQGDFVSGWWSSPTLYRGEGLAAGLLLAGNELGQPYFNQCYSWEGCVGRQASQLDTQSNRLKNNQYTQDASLNFKWNPTEKLRLNFDAQYVESEVKNYNASATARTFVNTYVDASGKYPTLTFEPESAENINLSPGGLNNANNYSYYSVTEHTEDSEGTELALRADAEYDFDGTWLDSIKVGVRYADRDQTVRWGAYNWANIANTWASSGPYYNIDKPIYGDGSYEFYTFDSDFFDGNQMNQHTFAFFSMDRLMDREGFGETLRADRVKGPGYVLTGDDFAPVCSNMGYRAGETIVSDYGCYKPNEILEFNEKTSAAYFMLKFGGPDATIGGIGVSGNIGARYVETTDTTEGSVTYPVAFSNAALVCTRPTPADVPPGAPVPPPTNGCVTSAEEIAFNNGSFMLSSAKAKHEHWLPSFNLKLDVTDEWVVRLAASRAMSRPDVGLLRNYVTVGRISPNLSNSSDPNIIRNTAGDIVGYNWQYQANSGNPYLEPITADQFDITAEYYFAAVGSLTATAFYKKFNNYIQNGTYNLDVTNNGVTRSVLVEGPMNGDGAKISGFEVAYQRFFDFLPAPWDGLGVQANYTYVKNDGIETTHLTNETGQGTAGGGVSYDGTAVKADALEGVSENAYNLVMMYEKGKIAARLAYNWRDEFLVTAIDCCTGLPIWQEAAGYLDGSVRYRVNDTLELSVQGSNLLGEDTVLLQQVNNDGLLKPNAWFKNDRRVQVGLTLKY